MKKFANELKVDSRLYISPIDDRVGDWGYSHTALLASQLEKSNFKPIYNSLIANNRVQYAGKSLKFREANRREFRVSNRLSGKDVVILDDIITTGTTMLEADNSLRSIGAIPKFAITLATT